MSSNVSRVITAKGATISFGDRWPQERDCEDVPRVKGLKFCDGHELITNMKGLAVRFSKDPIGEVASRFFMIHGKTYDKRPDRRTIEAHEDVDELV